MKTDRKTKKRGAFLSALQSLKPGECFYTEILPKGVTAYSSIYGIPVKTEIVLMLEGLKQKEQKVKRVTKVTIL